MKIRIMIRSRSESASAFPPVPAAIPLAGSVVRYGNDTFSRSLLCYFYPYRTIDPAGGIAAGGNADGPSPPSSQPRAVHGKWW